MDESALPTESQLRASLKEISDLKAALDEHAIVAITDPRGKITYVNDKFCAISQYAHGELIGQDHRLINSGHHTKEFIRELWTTIAAGRVWHGEIKNRAKDGSFYWVDTTIVPFLDEAGKPRQYVAIRADITERKNAEERLRAAAKEVIDLKAALDEHAIVAITNPRGKITYVNDKFCAISQYAREELIGQDHRLINSGHHPPEFIRELWTTIAAGRVWHGEIKNQAKDGSFYWVDTTIVPFLDEAGKPRQYVAIRADITERKRAEESMRASEARFRQLAEALPQLVWTCDGDGFCDYLSPQWTAYTGIDEARQLGFGWLEQVHPDDGQRAIARWHHATSTGGVYDVEFRIRRHDGVHRWFWTRAVPERDEAGRVAKWFGSCTDIDDLKTAQEEVLRLNASLERRVVERTAQLEAANRELEAFSYSVSHDLRAPLRAVDGFSQAVLEDYAAQLPADGRRYLQTIREGAQRMGALIDDLLAFSRLGRHALRIQTVDTNALVSRVLEELGAPWPERQVETMVHPLPACEGDPALLKQVWLNLAGNALKYTRQRLRATIEIGCERAGGGAVFFVRDNGTGFDMRYADKLFGVFQRLHRAEDYEGTGVGLAIVQRIVQRHGGRVWAEAEPDRGATFFFTLNASPSP